MRFKLMCIGILLLYILPTFLYPLQLHKNEIFKITFNNEYNKIIIDEDRVFILLKVREKLLKAKEKEIKEEEQKKIEEQKQVKEDIEWINIVATGYDNCVKCTGKTPKSKGYGLTASGVRANRGTISMPKEFQFYTKVYLEGLGTYVNHDTGSAIKRINKNTIKIDIWFSTHEEAKKFGRQNLRGYIIN